MEETMIKSNLSYRVAVLALSVTVGTSTASMATADEPPQSKPVVPEQTIQLLNGRDLSAWYVWLTDTGHEDSRGVFTIQKNGELRISGDGFGGLITKREYADYHLVMEFRWGTATWQTRKEKARDGGLLLHCQGPDVIHGPGFSFVPP
jgi:hypothetical protein